MCSEPSNGSGGGRGGAQARGTRGRASSARLGEPAAPAREGEPEGARAGARARVGPAQASPARPPLRSAPLPPSSPRRAGRGASTKTSTSERARAHPANSWPRPGPRGGSSQGTPGGRGQARVGLASDTGFGGRCGGRGTGVTHAPGTYRIAEKRVSKNRQQPSRRGGRPKRNKEHSPAPLRRRPWPPLTRAERSGGSRAARKEAVPPHSGAEGRERRSREAAPAAA